MKRAVVLPTYRDTKQFPAPEGIVEEPVDPTTGGVATPECPRTAQEYFIAGTEPTQYCQAHGQQQGQPGGSWLAHLFGKDDKQSPPPATSVAPNSPGASNGQNVPPSQPVASAKPGSADAQPAPESEKKKGLLNKIFGIFGSSKKPEDEKKPQPQQPPQ
jgi:hypothetical protein